MRTSQEARFDCDWQKKNGGSVAEYEMAYHRQTWPNAANKQREIVLRRKGDD